MKTLRKQVGFTLVELLVVIAIIGVLIALLLPAVQAAREAARRMQCSNHLKQIGIAVHNFHDTQQGLPPTSTGGTMRPSFWVLILPYMEQAVVYDNIMEWNDKGATRMTNEDFWNVLTEDQRKSTVVSTFFCPTRGQRATLLEDGVDNVGTTPDWASTGKSHGPQGDYAFVHGRAAGAAWGGWQTNHNPSTAHELRGAFRPAVMPDATDFTRWETRDSIAWWQDGTSNQIIVGEKFIAMDNLGRCEGSGTRRYARDCSMLVTGDWNIQSTCQSFWGRIAKNKNESSTANAQSETGDQPNWGGIHPGICMFLFGDGSVFGVSNTIPTGGSPTNFKTLSMLGFVDDGNPVGDFR